MDTPDPYSVSHGADTFQSQPRPTGQGEAIQVYDSPLRARESVEQSPQSDDDGQDNSQPDTANSVLFSKTLFVGSPAYKQRRKRSRKRSRRAGTATTGYDTEGSSSEPDVSQQALPLTTFSDWSTQPMGLQLGNTTEYHNHLPTQRLGQPLVMSTQHFGGGPMVTNTTSHVVPTMSRDRDSLRFASDELVQLPSPSAQMLHASKEAIAASSVSNTPGKGFTCPLIPCARVFKRLEHLKRHVRTHTQERPFGCDRCPKRFSRSDNLTQHLKTHEKADRGERMKTELSETTGDDFNFLEAEVDALTSRSHRPWNGVGQPGFSSRLRYSTHDGIAGEFAMLLLRSCGPDNE